MDFLVAVIIFLIIGFAIIYIVKAKKRGVKCIGCPAGRMCSGKAEGDCRGSGCSCHCDD